MLNKFMGLPIEQCVEKTVLKEKITVVIPTSQKSIKTMMLSVLSYLVNPEDRQTLEHICICIHGPDSRTGDPSLQDKKQAFLSELRDDYDSPLTVIRAWSRVGEPEAAGMALSWIHTDGYIMTNDEIAVRQGWTESIRENFYKEDNVAIASCGELFKNKFGHFVHRGMYAIQTPELNTSFLACKKKWLMKAGARWNSFFIPDDNNFIQFKLSDLPQEMFEFYDSLGMDSRLPDEQYSFIKQGIGAWVFYRLKKLGCKFSKLDEIVHHLEDSASMDLMETEVLKSRYADIYRKYL